MRLLRRFFSEHTDTKPKNEGTAKHMEKEQEILERELRDLRTQVALIRLRNRRDERRAQ